jgi:hypothetical protein
MSVEKKIVEKLQRQCKDRKGEKKTTKVYKYFAFVI